MSQLGPAVSFATTEHFNLQTARALTVSEANGRTSIYLAALSSNLVALALIGQISGTGGVFLAFALILLPVLSFMGAVTFLRLVQSSIEDLAYAYRIALVRSFYLQESPELAPYLLLSEATRRDATLVPSHAPGPSASQLTLTAAGMVAVINSVVMAASAGLVANAVGLRPLAFSIVLGAGVGVVAFALHERHHRRALDTYRPAAVDRAAIASVLPQPATA